MDERFRLADQLRRVHSGGAWHGPSLKEALDSVTASLASRRALPTAHSIHALAHHVAAWTGEVLQRLQGRAPQAPDEGDFPDLSAGMDDLAWQRLLAHIDAVHARTIEAILALDPSLLDRKVGDEDSAPLGTGHSYWGMINGLIQHDAYHAGQILLLKRALLTTP